MSTDVYVAQGGAGSQDGTSDANAYASPVTAMSALAGSTAADRILLKCNSVFKMVGVTSLIISIGGTSTSAMASMEAYYMSGGSPVVGVSGAKPNLYGDYKGWWESGKVLEAGDYVSIPKHDFQSGNGFWYRTNTAVTLGTAPTSFPTVNNATFVHNGATFTAVGYLNQGSSPITSAGMIGTSSTYIVNYFRLKNLKLSNWRGIGFKNDINDSTNYPLKYSELINVDFDTLALRCFTVGRNSVNMEMEYIIDGCTVHLCAQAGYDAQWGAFAAQGGSVATSLFSIGGATASDSLTKIMRNCVFTRNWGEGIISGDCITRYNNIHHAQRGPFVYYIPGTFGLTTVRHHRAYNNVYLGTTDDAFWRYSTGHCGYALDAASEQAGTGDISDVMEWNNLIAYTRGPFNIGDINTGPSKTFRDSVFAFNTCVDNYNIGVNGTGVTQDQGGTMSYIANNIFASYAAGNQPMAGGTYTGRHIHWGPNNWPSLAAAGNAKGANFSETDVYGDPLLTRTVWTNIYDYTDVSPNDDKPVSASSPVYHAGVDYTSILAAMGLDASGVIRNNPPTMGRYEIVTGAPGGGFLSASAVDSTLGLYDLTALGTDGWVHWGRTSASSFTRKSTDTSIGDRTALGTAGQDAPSTVANRPYVQYTDENTGGDLTSGNARANSQYFQGSGNGFYFDMDASTTRKTAYVLVSAYHAKCRFTVTLSDNSAAPYTVDVDTGDNTTSAYKTLVIDYASASASKTVRVQGVVLDDYGNTDANNVDLKAAYKIVTSAIAPQWTTAPYETAKTRTSVSLSGTANQTANAAAILYGTDKTDPTTAEVLALTAAGSSVPLASASQASATGGSPIPLTLSRVDLTRPLAKWAMVVTGQAAPVLGEVMFNPPDNWSRVQIADTPDTTTASVLYRAANVYGYTSDDLVGAIVDYRTLSNEGYAVTVDSTGVFSLAGGTAAQTFLCNIWLRGILDWIGDDFLVPNTSPTVTTPKPLISKTGSIQRDKSVGYRFYLGGRVDAPDTSLPTISGTIVTDSTGIAAAPVGVAGTGLTEFYSLDAAVSSRDQLWAGQLTAVGDALSDVSMQRLAVHSSGRYFVKELTGEPWYWQGDTAWYLHTRPLTEVRSYMDTRVSEMFTVVQGPALAVTNGDYAGWGFSDGGIPTYSGTYPFTTTPPNLTTSSQAVWNEPFLHYVGQVVDEALIRGLYVAVPITWGNHIKDYVSVNSAQLWQNLGAQVGRYFRRKPNVIYFVAGEAELVNSSHVMTQAEAALFDAIGDGLVIGDPTNRLISLHPDGGKTSRTTFDGNSWLKFSVAQTFEIRTSTRFLISSDYARANPLPVFNAEPGYDERNDGNVNDPMTAAKVRYEAAHSLNQGGGVGHTHGNNFVWTAQSGWMSHIVTEAAQDMANFQSFFQPRLPLLYAPFQSAILSSVGSYQQLNMKRAMISSGGSSLVVYFPSSGAVASNPSSASISLASMSGGTVDAYWYGLEDGLLRDNTGSVSSGPFTSYPVGSSYNFKPPRNDMFLVLDDQSKGYGIPGGAL